MTEQEAAEMENSKVFYGTDRKYVEIPPTRYPYGYATSLWCYNENAATPQLEDPSRVSVIRGLVEGILVGTRGSATVQELVGLLACVPI